MILCAKYTKKMQKNFCYHCLKVRIMYKDRYNDSLVRFFSVYYEKISENEVKSIINYTLGLKNDRFSRSDRIYVRTNLN